MNCVFKLYQQIGYPPSARDLLQSTCILSKLIIDLQYEFFVCIWYKTCI